MPPTKFQIEADQAFRVNQSNVKTILGDVDRAQPGIQSLVFSMRFRGWLTESERDLINRLSPENTTTFLAHNHHLFHPNDTNLHGSDLIGSEQALMTSEGAVFTHRLHRTGRRGTDTSRVHAARINPVENGDDEWTLGRTEPDQLATGRDYDSFGRLVTCFRSAWYSTSGLVKTVKEKLNNKTPGMVVNRASGKVLAANPGMADSLGIELHDLVDTEYSQLAGRLTDLTANFRLALDNVSARDIHLCVIKVKPMVCKTPVEATHEHRSDFLVHAMRNKISAITTAASHMQSIMRSDSSAEESELAEIILGEATLLDDHLRRLDVLVNYRQLSAENCSIPRELAGAADRVRMEQPESVIIELQPMACEVATEAPPTALNLLFESVVLSHLGQIQSRSNTAITCEDTPGTERVRVIVQSYFEDSLNNLHFDRNWTGYISSLAELMNIDVQHEATPDQNKLETILSIPTTKE